MRVTVDRNKCSGHAQCSVTAPDVYDLDDEGYCAVNDLLVPTELEHAAEAGAQACPEGAIIVQR